MYTKSVGWDQSFEAYKTSLLLWCFTLMYKNQWFEQNHYKIFVHSEVFNFWRGSFTRAFQFKAAKNICLKCKISIILAQHQSMVFKGKIFSNGFSRWFSLKSLAHTDRRSEGSKYSIWKLATGNETYDAIECQILTSILL